RLQSTLICHPCLGTRAAGTKNAYRGNTPRSIQFFPACRCSDPWPTPPSAPRASPSAFLGSPRLPACTSTSGRGRCMCSRPPLARLGVESDPRTSVRRLSVRQQQEVEAAKALSQAARIVIMDEPTAALTWNEIQNLFRIIRQLKTEGVAILYVSHRLEEAAQ